MRYDCAIADKAQATSSGMNPLKLKWSMKNMFIFQSVSPEEELSFELLY